MTSPANDPHGSLDQAASLLVHLGRNLNDQIDAGASMHCLLAADYLACAGAHPSRRTDPLPDNRAAADMIRQILALLAGLPSSLLDNDLVLDAVTETRQALTMAA